MILAGIRALGLTRPGRPAAGLPDDFAVRRRHPAAGPSRGEPGRDLPPEIMRPAVRAPARAGSHGPTSGPRSSCSSTPAAGPRRSVSAPAGTAWTSDSDGKPVLVYDNHKAARTGGGCPVAEATAKVITGQQQRVRARFPGTPAASWRCCRP